jgi:hypothetical protein
LLSYLTYILGEQMRRQDISEEDTDDIGLMTKKYIERVTNKAIHEITSLTAPPKQSTQPEQGWGDGCFFIKKILGEELFRLAEDCATDNYEDIWEQNYSSFFPKDYTDKKELKQTTNILMDRMLLQHCQILRGDDFLKILQNAQTKTSTTDKQLEEKTDQNKDSVGSTSAPARHQYDQTKTLTTDKQLEENIDQKDIDGIKSQIKEMVQSPRYTPENFYIILYPEAGEKLHPYAILENREGNNNEIRGEHLRILLDKKIQDAKSEQSETTLKKALSQIVAESKKTLLAVARPFAVLIMSEIVNSKHLAYFAKGMEKLAMPHIKTAYEQHKTTIQQQKIQKREEARAETRAETANKLLRNISDSLSEKRLLHWTYGFYAYLAEELQKKDTLFNELLEGTPSSLAKLRSGLSTIEAFLIQSIQEEKPLTPQEVKQINFISKYLRSLISLGKSLKIFTKNALGPTFKTVNEANREIEIIEQFILPFILNKKSRLEDIPVCTIRIQRAASVISQQQHKFSSLNKSFEQLKEFELIDTEIIVPLIMEAVNQQNLTEDIFRSGYPESFDIRVVLKSMLTKHCKILEYNEAEKDPEWQLWCKSENCPAGLKEWINKEKTAIFFIKDTSRDNPTYVFLDNRTPTRAELRSKKLKKLLCEKIKQTTGDDSLFTSLIDLSQKNGLEAHFAMWTTSQMMRLSHLLDKEPHEDLSQRLIDCLKEVEQEYHDQQSQENQNDDNNNIETLAQSLKNKFTQTISYLSALYSENFPILPHNKVHLNFMNFCNRFEEIPSEDLFYINKKFPQLGKITAFFNNPINQSLLSVENRKNNKVCDAFDKLVNVLTSSIALLCVQLKPNVTILFSQHRLSLSLCSLSIDFLCEGDVENAEKCRGQAAKLLSALQTDNETMIHLTAQENIDKVLIELARRSETPNIPDDGIRRMTMPIVDLLENADNANRFKNEKYLQAVLDIIAYIEILNAKKDTQDLAVSLSRSTIALLDNFTQTNAELITIIKPVYEELVNVHRHATTDDKNIVTQLKNTTTAFFGGKEQIHKRYDTFKRECETQTSRLPLVKAFLKAVTKLISLLVGITPVIIDGLRFFKSVPENYANRVADAIEPVRGEIRKREREQEKETSASSNTADKPTGPGLNSTATAEEEKGNPTEDSENEDFGSEDSFDPKTYNSESFFQPHHTREESAPIPHTQLDSKVLSETQVDPSVIPAEPAEPAESEATVIPATGTPKY